MKGASGQALQNANLVLGLPETHRPLRRRAHAVSVTVASPGSRPAGSRAGIKPSGAPDLAIVATADRRAGAAAGVFTTNLVAAAPVQISRSHLADGRAAAVVLNSGNANAATGEPGRRDALRMCELTARGRRLRDRATCSCAHRPDRHPDADGRRSRRASRSSAPRSAPTPPVGTRPPTRSSPPTPCARRRSQPVELARRRHRHRRRHGQGRGDARRRRWPRCSRCSPPTPPSSPAPLQHAAARARSSDSFNALIVDGCTSTNDTVLRARQRRGRQRADHARRRPRLPRASATALTAACADLARQMAADAEGATKLRHARRARRALRRPRRAARRARSASSQLVQCSLYGEDPYWGRVLSELGASGACFDPERSTSRTTASSCAATASRAAHDADRARAA